MTVLDGQSGEVIRNYPVLPGKRPPRRIRCSPTGRVVFSDWGNTQRELPGPYRWENSLSFIDGDEPATVFRDGIPGEDRVQYFEDGVPVANGPRAWGRYVDFAATDDGVWMGTGDDDAVEFIDWAGTTTHRIWWMGPDPAVTEEHMGAYRASNRARFSGPNARPPLRELVG